MGFFFLFKIKFLVAEIKRNVDRDTNEVEYVKEKTEKKDHGAKRLCVIKKVSESCDLNRFSDNTECIAYEKKDFKEKTLPFGGFGNQRFPN